MKQSFNEWLLELKWRKAKHPDLCYFLGESGRGVQPYCINMSRQEYTTMYFRYNVDKEIAKVVERIKHTCSATYYYGMD